MISEFKLIALASMIYVLLDHFGGLKMVEKSLKNSGDMMILMGKVSLIIISLIVLNRILHTFKIVEGINNNNNNISTKDEFIDNVKNMKNTIQYN